MRSKTKKIMRRTPKIDFGLKINRPIVKGIPKMNKGNPYKHSTKLLNMNWKQAKKRFPGLSPTGDIDFDGTRNKFDCKPLDPARDGILSGILRTVGFKKTATKMEAKEYERKMNKTIKRKYDEREQRAYQKSRDRRDEEDRKQNILKRMNRKFGEVRQKVRKEIRRTEVPGTRTIARVGKKVVGSERGRYGVGAFIYGARKIATGQGITQSKSGQKKSGPGRPSGVYIHTSPLTGQKVPATIYYKHVKAVRRRIQSQAQQSQLRQQAVMAKRGIPPQIAQQVIQQRTQALVEPPEQEITSQEAPIQAREAYEEQPQQAQVPIQQVQQMQMQQQMQRLTPAQIRMMQRRQQAMQPRYQVSTDILTGRRIIKQLPQPERWIYD